jgi:hypothetical protein
LAVLPVGDGKIILNGTTPQTFSSSGSIANGIDIEINNPSGVIIPSALTSGGGMILRSGSLLQLPDLDVSLGGNIDSETGVTLIANKGRLILNGPSDQTVNLAGNVLNQLNLNKPGGTAVTLTGAMRLRDRLTIQSQNTILRSNGNLTLLSTSDDGLHDAGVSEIPPGSSVQGNVTVQRHMSGEGRIYRYISSAVQGSTIDSLQDDFPITGTFDDPTTGPGLVASNPSFFYYDESSPGAQGWTAYPNGGMAHDNELQVGVGYAAFIRQALLPTRWDVTGVLNQGPITIPVTFTNSNDDENDGWNLVGNPYAAPIDWDQSVGWTKTNILPGIAVRDNGNRRFLYWDGEVGNLGNGRIAAGQAFWIRTSDDNPSLTIRESAKSTIQTPFYRMNDAVDFMEVAIEGINGKDQAYLRLREGARTEAENFDVVKFPNDVVNLFFPVDSLRLAIHAVDKVDCALEIPLSLNFQQLSSGSWVQSPLSTYNLSASTFGIFDQSSAVLLDKLLGLEHNLALPYHFEIKNDDEATFTNRFNIRFDVLELTTVGISADSIVCPNGTYSLHLSNLQPGVRYSVLVNGVRAIVFVNPDREVYEVVLDPNVFQFDKNQITFVSESICERNVQTFWTTRFRNPEITETELGLVSNIGTQITWFDDENSQPMSTEAVFKPAHSGRYRLVVRGKHCADSTSYHYYHQDEHLQIFPIPVSSELNIVAPQQEVLVKLRVDNVLTNETLRVDIQQRQKPFRLSMQQFCPGVYLLSVVTDRAVYRRKIIVE